MEAVAGVEDPRAPGGGAGELDRPLDRLGAGVGGHHRGDPCRGARDERLGQHARKDRHAELGEVRAVRVDQLAQRGDDIGVVAPDREGPVAAEQVEVARPVGVDQVRSFAAHPDAVEAERANDPPELGVEEAVVERHRLAGARSEGLSDGGVSCDHGEQPTRRVRSCAVTVLHLLLIRK